MSASQNIRHFHRRPPGAGAAAATRNTLPHHASNPPMSKATLTLSSDGEGIDTLMLETDFHGEYDPTSTAHNTIRYLGAMLEVQAERAMEAQKAQAEAGKVKLLLPIPKKLQLATDGGAHV